MSENTSPFNQKVSHGMGRQRSLAALIIMAALPPFANGADQLGVRVPDGFTVSLFADDNLAHDIYSMTIDSLGRVVVSGAGYVRILIDSDGDGTADQFKQFSDGPQTGAQGMYFVGRDLLCIGDGGLLCFRDRDGNDRADGPPDLFLKLKTGGEHHAHSLQKGPDGWWYIISGNQAEITGTYATLQTSPIKQPQAGTILRLQPDLSGGEILADGFRNAYDFAFNRQGDIFTYDSDGERDITLPWYRPTRVFHILPGSNAGWSSRSWKRPKDFLDMPPVIAAFGRGSPTGVVNYRHDQFPEKYDDAIFVLDWTFGRVMALPLRKNGSTYSSEPIRFMVGVGQFGFAPTDIEVGRDGSLYVSVGGRGTRGGVFRVTYGNPVAKPSRVDPKTPREILAASLNAPQPLSSWSRARWVPWAEKLGRDAFLEVALNEGLTPPARMRAIEIATELFGGLDTPTLWQLAKARSADVRARAAWSLGRIQSPGRIQPPQLNMQLVLAYLNDRDPLVARFAMEAAIQAGQQTDFRALVSALVRGLASSDRFRRLAASRVVAQLDTESFKQVSIGASQAGWQAGLSNALGYLSRKPGFNAYAFRIGLPIVEEDHPTSLKLEAIRLMQLGLGDVGSSGRLPPVFDGYASRLDLTDHERELDPVRIRLAKLFPTGERKLDLELARLLAMLTPYNSKLLDQILDQITETSHPVDDIHYLIVADRIPASRTNAQQEIIAKALVDLQSKIDARQLNQDSNWDDRIGEMYAEHVKLAPSLPAALLKQPNFGLPGHVVFLSQLPKQLLPQAIAAFENKVHDDDEYSWNSDVIFVFGESSEDKHRELVRQQFGNFAVRSAVLMVLAVEPDEQDRDEFISGLESSQIEVLTACIDALTRLPDNQQPIEQIALVRALRRLGVDSREYVLREEFVRLMRRKTKQNFGFEFGTKGHRPQADVTKKWTAWVGEVYPKQSAQLLGDSQADLSKLKNLLADVDWDQGIAARGKTLFTSRACSQCHGGRRALGPDLSGVAGRFSREDLFMAIALPNRDVSPRYQTTLIQTTAGKVYTGLIVYEAVDGLLLRNAMNQTFRIEAAQIEFRRKLPQSLMPAGLLKDLRSLDLADLYAYIRSLGERDKRLSVRSD